MLLHCYLWEEKVEEESTYLLGDLAVEKDLFDICHNLGVDDRCDHIVTAFGRLILTIQN